MKQSKNNNDLWSSYAYGNAVKYVYHKTPYNCDCDKSRYIRTEESQTEPEERFSQSLSRTKSTIFELAMCNPFEYFCTFTINWENRDRFDLNTFRRDLAQFIRDENKKRGERPKIKYVMIPEQHKDGAWHMHGVLMGLDNQDLTKNEYGYLDWNAYRRRFGFFSCSCVKSHIACSKYITKYITKDFESATDIDGNKHMFFASQGLKRREEITHMSGEKCPVENWDFENDYVKICWVYPDSYKKV